MKSSKSYESQFSAIDSEHAARNRGSDSSMMSQPAGGSAHFTDPGPKAKSHKLADGLGGLKKLMGGKRPDTATGKNVV